jgi:hypothetical protein
MEKNVFNSLYESKCNPPIKIRIISSDEGLNNEAGEILRMIKIR